MDVRVCVCVCVCVNKIKYQNMDVRCWPPSISTALTKQRWRSGVHLSLGTGDRTYGLTPLPP